MTLILLVFAALIVALQIALTFTLKRMLDLLIGENFQLAVETTDRNGHALVSPPVARWSPASPSLASMR